MPMINQIANDIFLYSQGNEWVMCPMVSIQDKPRYYFEMLAQEGEAETVAIVHADDTLFTGHAMGAKKYAQEAGLEIVYVEQLPAATTDFTSVITHIKEVDPDIVYDAGFGVALIKQAKELGLEPREFYSHGSSGKPFIEGLGDRAEYIMDEMWTPAPGQELGDAVLWEEVYTKADFDPLEYTFVAACYMSYEVLLQALERVEDFQDGEQLRDTILNGKYLTIGGLVSFNTTSLEHGYGLGSVFAYPTQIMNGRPVVVAPEWAKAADHIYPTP
jgi:branched-chain amino acid transport system substrate-binding protein